MSAAQSTGSDSGPLGQQIRLYYSCPVCKLTRSPVMVPCRSEEAAVERWMQLVVSPALARDHHRRAPLCQTDRFTNLYIPLPENGQHIGAPAPDSPPPPEDASA